MPSDDLYGDGPDYASPAALWSPPTVAPTPPPTAPSDIPEVVVSSNDLPEGLERQPLPPVDDATVNSWLGDIKLETPPAPDLSGLPALPTYFDDDAPPMPADGTLLGSGRDKLAPLHLLLSVTRPFGTGYPFGSDRKGKPGDRNWCIERCSDLTEAMHPKDRTDELNRCIQHCMGTNWWPQWAYVFDKNVIPGLDEDTERHALPPLPTLPPIHPLPPPVPFLP